MLNIPKSQLEPHQLGGWLGFITDLCKGNFHVPEEKVDDLKSSIRQAYVQSRVPVKQLASIVGKIISMTLAIGPVSRPRTRALYTTINSRRSWCDSVALPQNAREELEFGSGISIALMVNQYGLTLVLQELCTHMLPIVAMGATW